MKESEKTNSVRHDGADNEFIYFSVNSESLPNTTYSILIGRHDGTVLCDCPDARFRTLVGYVHKESTTCKHVRRLKLWIEENINND